MLARNIRRIGAALGSVVFAYLAAGLTGGAIPANPGWRPPMRGVTIYVEDNGIHTDLVLPKRAAGIDLAPLAPARDLADPRFGAHRWLAIGWGEAAFFLDTPTWWDVRPGTVLAAMLGSERSLLHVEHVPEPRADGSVRRIVLRPEEYRRLARFVAASFVEHGQHHHGYAGFDAFYPAKGHYNALRTCNAWTGRALRQAGVRVGAWTPFPITVTSWFPRAQSPAR